MPILSAIPARRARGTETFEEAFQDAAARPVTEIVPAQAGDGLAAFGFALGWLLGGPGPASSDATTLLVTTDDLNAENGGLYPPGLSQFGLDASRVLHVRARLLKEALWASEQALALSHMRVLCAVPRDGRLTLTATRRLHLAAEKSGARCVLLRFDPLSPSAAWTRWSVAAASSDGANRELGRPRFAVSLIRQRSGQSGQRWVLEWNAHEHAFIDTSRSLVTGTLAVPVVTPDIDGSAETHRRRAS